MTFMHNANSDKLAEDVMNAHAEEVAVRYIESMKKSSMIHRNVASAINGLREILELKSSRAPGQAISDADRLESCFLVSMTHILREMIPLDYEIKVSIGYQPGIEV